MPGLGTGGGKFAVSLGWRFSDAHTSYIDSHVNRTVTNLWLPRQKLSFLDVTARYRVNRRLNLTVSVPIAMNNFSMLFPQRGQNLGERYAWSASGLGDITMVAESLVFDPAEHPFGNVSLALGIKPPTGNYSSTAWLPNATGDAFARLPVWPMSMQPGDGGTGIITGIQAYKVFRKQGILRGQTVFASANYLTNIRNQNGVPSAVAALGVPIGPEFANRVTNSVPDTYNIQGGASIQIPGTWDNPKLKGLRLRLLGSWQGIPSHDLLGGSSGFRGAGTIVAVGPGITYQHGRNLWILDVPIKLFAHINPATSSVPSPAVIGSNGSINPAPFNAARNLGMVAPCSISLRYVRTF